MFDAYLFADYSGAADERAQRTAIKVAYAEHANAPRLLNGTFTRDSLVAEIVNRLTSAPGRVCFGQDHNFGLPIALAEELGIADQDWRTSLLSFIRGTPAVGHPRQFAKLFNDKLEAPYFWSATKGTLYGLPTRNPRTMGVYRLTERSRSAFGTGTPKPFNRVGDPGSVGGQSLLGMAKLIELLELCAKRRIRLKVWPFEGLDIFATEYDGAHVMMEAYPTAFRPAHVPQSDSADALWTVTAIQAADGDGTLATLLDLGSLQDWEKRIVRFEGWILGMLPLNGSSR